MRVAIIGASADRSKYGNKAVRAYLRGGHEVYPVNPTEAEIEGIRCYSTIAEVPGSIDRAAFYVLPRVGVGVVRQIAERGGVGEVFLNPGTESPELIAEAGRLGVRIVQGCAILDIGQFPD